MPTQTIESPGVQINEVDLSLRAVVPNGTNVLVLGYAPQGPIEEVLEIPDVQTFSTIYGTPTNAAERYFYYSVRGVLNGGGRPIVSRLPYGGGTGAGSTTKYSCLAYPAVPFNEMLNHDCAGTVTLSNETSGYFIGAPSYLELSEQEYLDLVQGNVNWVNNIPAVNYSNLKDNPFTCFSDLASAGLIVLNKFQSTFDYKTFEGYTIGFADSLDTDPQSDFNSVTSIKYAPYQINNLPVTNAGEGEFLTIPQQRLNFVLASSATSNNQSVSRQIEQQDPNLNLFQGSFIDSVSVKVTKLRQSIYTPQTVTLDYTFPDGFLGSFNSRRTVQSQNGGQPVGFYIGDTENSSTYVSIIVNPNISTNSGDWTNAYGKPSKFVLFHHSILTTKNKTDAVTRNISFEHTPLYNAANVTLEDFWNGMIPGGTPDYDTFLGNFIKPTQALYSYCPTVLNNVDNNAAKFAVGNIPAKIDRVFQTIDDVDALRIDLSVEAGLGTMYSSTQTLGVSAYDDTIVVNIGATPNGQASTGFYATNGDLTANLTTNVPGIGSPTYTAEELKTNYLAVYEEFRAFAQDVRKDHLFIADPYRPIFITGATSKVLSNKNNTFTQHINTPLRNLYDTTSTSYATVYGNWALVNDLSTGSNVWVPVSGLIAGMMSKDDANYAPWYAPAGFTRGKFPSPVLDIAVTPSQRNRDLLYKQGINPITKFPNDGITVFGQKTKLSTPSAFDRINVRRLFLYLEKVTRSTLKYFVFEPNTLFTRTNVVNVLTPIFESVKNNQGMYDYLIVCDARNNTPTVIDNNQLVVDIYIKPTRSAEFILVNFYATRTDQDFNELV